MNIRTAEEIDRKNKAEEFLEELGYNLDLMLDQLADLAPDTYVISKKKRDIAQFSDLSIRTKETGLQKFMLNSTQQAYHKLLHPGYDPYKINFTDFRGIRDQVLKGRQFGLSTYIMGNYFLQTISIPHTTSYIMAHDRPSTNTLFETIKLFHRFLPDKLRPIIGKSNEKELYFPELNSRFQVGTAGSSGSIGRGGTLTNFLGSEVAHWENPEEIMKGLGESIPMKGNIFLETTANGIGNFFHQAWIQAVAHKSVYKARFFCWLDVPEYNITFKQIKYDPQFELLKEFDPKNNNKNLQLDEEEQILVDKFGASINKILWRRYKLLQPGASLDLFHQEYPTTWQEAFVSSGKTFFSNNTLIRIQGEITSKPGFFEEDQNWTIEHHPLLIQAAKSNDVKIYKKPNPKHTYIVLGDIAEGLTKDGKHDFSVADVFSINDWEQVAQIHLQIPTKQFAQLMIELGYYYNHALLVPERNNFGLAVINEIENHKPSYGRSRTHAGLYLHDDDKPGFPTNEKTRADCLATLEKCLDDGSLIINCTDTISEFFSFIKKPNGRAEAEKNCFDDRVTTAWLAAFMLFKLGGKVLPFTASGGLKRMKEVIGLLHLILG